MYLRMCIWKRTQGISEVVATYQAQPGMAEARTVPLNHQSPTQLTLV